MNRTNQLYTDVGGGFYVTSGRRGADRQAAAMYENYKNNTVPSYVNKNAFNEVTESYKSGVDRGLARSEIIKNMTDVLQRQMDNGVFLSKHQTGMAIDIKRSGIDQSTLDRIRANPAVQRVYSEKNHWHIQFK